MAKSGPRSNKLLFVLLLAAAVPIISAIVDFIFVASGAKHDDEFLALTAQQSVLSQSMVKDADEALTGNNDAFKRLLTARDQFDRGLRLQIQGDSDTLMPAVTGDVASAVSDMQSTWTDMRSAAQTILDAHDSIVVANQAAATVDSNMPPLLANWDKVANLLIKDRMSRKLIYHAGRQGFYGQRILRDVETLTSGGGGGVKDAANRLPADEAYFARIEHAMFDGDPELGIVPITNSQIRNRLHQTDAAFSKVNSGISSITSITDVLTKVHAANEQIHSLSAQLMTKVGNVVDSYNHSVNNRIFQPIYGYVLGGAGLLVIAIIVYVYLLTGDVRRAAFLQQEQNERNQEAILRLLDELGSLADGDLTVQVTVTEDITGAIADSINYALEALRDLVTTINDTAVQVDAAARQTQATATHLADASENQSQQITTASSAISKMATSIEQVSANAERSAKVAQQSVEIAHKGGEAVRRTIDGMNSIRETIQETSKRIKRLGESSQEIGDIVELINDIAEQTNILALNAAIQASMAGEAGRGFAVVADEVQRLAERSANATKQIEALVKAIQTDTNEAVISMEQSTAGVVGGAQLAENAGSALDEIEKVSNHIATLIQSISSAARQQAVAATDVSRTMNVIREITSQTAEGTQATAQSIGKLAALATELRKSVAGFKLPTTTGQETMVMTVEEHA